MIITNPEISQVTDTWTAAAQRIRETDDHEALKRAAYLLPDVLEKLQWYREADQEHARAWARLAKVLGHDGVCPGDLVQEAQALRTDVQEWKDAWHHQRDVSGYESCRVKDCLAERDTLKAGISRLRSEVASARQEERAAVVRWLLDQAGRRCSGDLSGAAEAIEAGEHLKEPSDG